jgi:PAS domain S-box-containing protein
MTSNNPLFFESETAFHALFHYATIGILVVDANGNMKLANPCLEKLFGYSNTDLIGHPVEILLPEMFREIHVQHRDLYFKNPKARPMGYGLSLITDKQRTLEELEDKVAERTLELTQSIEREKELSEMKSRFVAMASHEFRTPLTSIVANLSLIKAYNKDIMGEKSLKLFERVQSSISNLTSILNNFLSLERIEQGNMEVAYENFDLCEFAEDVIQEMNGLLKPGQKIILTCTGEKDIVQDKRILKNVFLNLLSNAVKYSGENKPIYFSIVITDLLVTIKIRDEGIGIPVAEQQKLFSIFYRATNVANLQGSGLGLTIVKRYVELMGGHIDFTSEPLTGTTFSLEFPVKPEI